MTRLQGWENVSKCKVSAFHWRSLGEYSQSNSKEETAWVHYVHVSHNGAEEDKNRLYEIHASTNHNRLSMWYILQFFITILLDYSSVFQTFTTILLENSVVIQTFITVLLEYSLLIQAAERMDNCFLSWWIEPIQIFLIIIMLYFTAIWYPTLYSLSRFFVLLL